MYWHVGTSGSCDWNAGKMAGVVLECLRLTVGSQIVVMVSAIDFVLLERTHI